MRKSFERKTVFLYPDLAKLNRDEILTTNSLITDINLVVNSANDLIRKILASGSFSFINCLPTVLMKSICEAGSECIDCNNVRICISGYSEIDYTENYKKLVSQYKTGRSDISHLVAIHITKTAGKPQFIRDANENFDVIVKSNIDHLENILVSIMLDISLYHYFLLSNDLTTRRDFNETKLSHIFNDSGDLMATYGIKPGEPQPLYLPISLANVVRLDRFVKEESRKTFISELINDYANFLSKAIAYHLKFNKNGSIYDTPDRSQLYNYSEIEKFIKDNCSISHYFIIVPENLTENRPITMIQCNSENNLVSSWVNKNFENIGAYQLIEVERKD